MFWKGSLVCLFLCFSWTEARIWAWMLNMPHSPPKEGAKALRESAPDAKVLTVRIWTLWLIINLVFNAPTGLIHSVVLQAVCDHDKSCGRGFSCDRHFGLCVPLRGEGHYCRRDAQCVRGLSCMFGKCHRSIPNGQEGESAALNPKHEAGTHLLLSIQRIKLLFSPNQAPGVKLTESVGRPCVAPDIMVSKCARGDWLGVRTATFPTVAWLSASTRFARVKKAWCVVKTVSCTRESKSYSFISNHHLSSPESKTI